MNKAWWQLATNVTAMVEDPDETVSTLGELYFLSSNNLIALVSQPEHAGQCDGQVCLHPGQWPVRVRRPGAGLPRAQLLHLPQVTARGVARARLPALLLLSLHQSCGR